MLRIVVGMTGRGKDSGRDDREGAGGRGDTLICANKYKPPNTWPNSSLPSKDGNNHPG